VSEIEQTENPPGKPLNDRQAALIDTLVMGRTISAAAKECGVARRTAHGWLQDDAFQAALAARRQEIADRVGEDIADVQRLAVAVVKTFLTEDRPQMSAYKLQVAQAILFKMSAFSPPRAQRDTKTSTPPTGGQP
jgi:hypothetical protein